LETSIAKERLNTDCRVVLPAIVRERPFADGGIEAANGIETERTLTDSRVVVASAAEAAGKEPDDEDKRDN